MDLRGLRIVIPGASVETGRALAVRLHTLSARNGLADPDSDVLSGPTKTTSTGPSS